MGDMIPDADKADVNIAVNHPALRNITANQKPVLLPVIHKLPINSTVLRL